jgi:hypothetical protein
LFAGGDSNLYGYVVNDPVNSYDFTGKNPVAVVAILYGAILYDAIKNIEYHKNEATDDFTVRIPPPSMWTKGVLIPFPAGVDLICGNINTPIGTIGYPKNIDVTVDPRFMNQPDFPKIPSS